MENSIGKRIATLRKQNGWSQVELASMLNVSDTSVRRWEHGNQKISRTKYERLKRYL